MNAALAMIEAAAPENEIEAALAIQMACTHTAQCRYWRGLDRAAALIVGWCRLRQARLD
jgi:hypothetical protein